ncbi:T9SS type A sorting domain-containing protein [Candidatus Desantisbacteria bacterium]|nr:T9SS type A sorting domain-containing protein [Candidatus Desantisbacteria bacterium]
MTKYLIGFLIISLFAGVEYSSAVERAGDSVSKDADNTLFARVGNSPADDTVPPYIIWDDDSYPDGASVWTDSIISFDLADDSSGVATRSIHATLNNMDQPTPIENIDGQYHITCRITTPNIPMYNKEMLIRIQASDYADNQMPPFERKVFVSSRTLSIENVIAYPNPWQNGSGNICFSPLPQNAEIRIFDVSGECVKDICLSLVEGKWEWDLRDNEDNGVAPGLYIYLVKDKTRHTLTTGKILIVR